MVAMALIGLGVAAITAYASPMWQVTSVEVRGNDLLSAEQITEKAGVLGKSILAVDVKEVEKAITSLGPAGRVVVSRSFPDRITISVEERPGWGAWQVGQTRYLIDGEGVVLTDKAPPSLPTIRAMDGKPLQSGDRVDGGAVKLAQTLIQVLPQKMGLQARSFEYLSYGGLVVITDAGWRARVGDASDLDYKFAVWKAILDKKGELPIKPVHVDLRFGARPFFRQ